MKTSSTSSQRQGGSSLLIAIVITGVLSFSIAGYLAYVAQQNRIIWRSQYWNQCIPVAEAGVEESLMCLARNSITNLAAGGWTSGTNGYYLDRFLSSDNSTWYHAVISGNTNAVTNTVSARVYMPTSLGSNYVTRTVQVIATNAPLFNMAIVGIDIIDFNNKSVSLGCGAAATNSGGGILNLNIAANVALLNLLDICLQGNVSLGPNGAAVGANASVTGIINLSAATDLNVQFNSVVPPITSGAAPSSNVKWGGQTYTLGASGNIYMSAINLTGNQQMLVTGNTTIYVAGNVNIQDNASIYVAPGANLQIYVAGQNTSIGGNGVNVSDQNPMRFQYYGLDSNTSVVFNGPAAVQSLIYAPNATVELGTTVTTGGLFGILGTLQLTFNGAVVGKDVKFDTDTNYYFDQQVITSGPRQGYVVYSWTEL